MQKLEAVRGGDELLGARYLERRSENALPQRDWVEDGTGDKMEQHGQDMGTWA